MTRPILLALTISVAAFFADEPVSQSERSRELADLAKLAAMTRTDHFVIFFASLVGQGYVSDGNVALFTADPDDLYSGSDCYGSAISKDGSRIAFARPSIRSRACRIELQDLRTGEERTLTEADLRGVHLTWAWDDSQILFVAKEGIVAVSIADGTKRVLGRLPLRVGGKLPTEGWQLFSVDWLHHRPELVLDAGICTPTGEAGECENQRKVVLWLSGDSRVLDSGACAAVSPTDDSIAFVAKDGVVVMKADGTDRRIVTPVPSTAFFLPFIKEDPWTSIVWSPDGQRLWFNTIIDEGGRMNVYLVDVRRGRRKRVLTHSMVRIIAWRQTGVSLPPTAKTTFKGLHLPEALLDNVAS